MKNKLLILFIFLFFVINSGILYANDNPLIGEWVTTSRSQGGLGGSKEYKEDGTVVVTFGALLDFKYKLIGNNLSVFDENGELVSKEEIELSGSKLILKNIKTGKEQKLTSINEKPVSSIIGKWSGDHYTGGKQIFHFTTGLNCYFSVPMIISTAEYEINGDSYIEESSEKGRTEWNVNIKDDILTLKKIDGSKIEVYKKKR